MAEHFDDPRDDIQLPYGPIAFVCEDEYEATCDERDALAARVEALEAQRDEALTLIERLASPNARSAARTEEGALIQIEVEQIAREARRILSGERESTA